MFLSIFSPVFGGKTFEELLIEMNKKGATHLEIGSGYYPGKEHLDCHSLLEKEKELNTFTELLEKYNIQISAISCHGNPVSPNREIAEKSHNDFVYACKLAKKLNVKTVITFSGCPGSHDEDKLPNWVTCSWPPEYLEILDYQWNKVLVPYWKNAMKIAEENDVRVALEMHPGFCVYNPHTMKKLVNMVGSSNLGANFDPSHLYWQQINIISAIKDLGELIFHFHAKDTYIDFEATNINGVLDTNDLGDIENRSWYFKTVGYGHSTMEWKNILSQLRRVGYNGAISIEHEDAEMSIEEGLDKAVKFIEPLLLKEDPSKPWWI